MVGQELFAGYSLLTALPKVSARKWFNPTCPTGDQRWRDEPTPQRGELVVYRPPVTWTQCPERDTNVPRHPEM